jgi:signal transduction histidine kinase
MDLHAQSLLREPGLPPGVSESATQIRAAARQLTRMILNLLDVSKADEGQLAPKRTPLDVTKLVDGVLADLDVSAQSRRVHLQRAVEANRVLADEDLLRRTLTNLVENAIRHAPPETTIKVAATTVDGATELRVSDAGSGIPPELREKVFDAFVQADRSGAAQGNRGLGLTFCKVAVEAHGGRIWVEDGTPGAIFCVRLPNDGA